MEQSGNIFLAFEKNEIYGVYEAYFEAYEDFNLHIEKPTGSLQVLVVTPRGYGLSFCPIEGVAERSGDRVFDYDFTGIVYPKTIKIACVQEPYEAHVTFVSSAGTSNDPEM